MVTTEWVNGLTDHTPYPYPAIHYLTKGREITIDNGRERRDLPPNAIGLNWHTGEKGGTWRPNALKARFCMLLRTLHIHAHSYVCDVVSKKYHCSRL